MDRRRSQFGPPEDTLAHTPPSDGTYIHWNFPGRRQRPLPPCGAGTPTSLSAPGGATVAPGGATVAHGAAPAGERPVGSRRGRCRRSAPPTHLPLPSAGAGGAGVWSSWNSGFFTSISPVWWDGQTTRHGEENSAQMRCRY